MLKKYYRKRTRYVKNIYIFVFVNVHGMMKKRVGVKDIAAKAGVSIGTVDRVLHNRGEVKTETKEKVMSIIKELGYQPNVMARTLSSKKTTRIAIVIPDSSDNNPYWAKPVIGIQKAREELFSFNVEIIFRHFDASSEESFKQVLSDVCDENPNGIVLNPVFKSASLQFIGDFKIKNIPYAFVDVNIKGVGKLGYFGQDAEQSGIVSARLMKKSTPEKSNILIVKQSKNKVFSEHIESRVAGFLKPYSKEIKNGVVNVSTVEINLDETDEPNHSLSKVFSKQGDFDGIFVPNSRVFKVADFLDNNDKTNNVVVGYDLVVKNVEHLKKGNIDYLISQKPEEQAYNSIMALFNNLITKKEVAKTTYSPIDIIIKENIDYYNINK